MRTFVTIWFGQLVSLIGTAMTRFALLIWAYQQTGNATTIALLGFFSFAPLIVVSPFAGIWVDRLNRRLVMLLADLAAGVITAVLLLLFATDQLAIWHLFVAETLTGFFTAFQRPAYTAAITQLIPKAHFGRASGMISMAESSSQIAAPFLAGLLVVVIDIDGVMLIDIATFLVAVITLAIVRIPTLATGAGENLPTVPNYWQQLRVGSHFILARRGLLGLLFIYMGMNFFGTITYFAILPAMVLARTGGNEIAVGSVQAALGIGGIIGGLLMSLWGGPKRRIHAILAGAALSFFIGDFLFATGRTLPAWITGALLAQFFIPLILGNAQALWQVKTPAAIQGRVFSTKNMLQMSTIPPGYLVAGPLADRVFEPALANPEGWLAITFGSLVGTGPGSGMGFMFLCTAVLGTCMSLSGYLFAAVRNVETDLPDAI